MSDSKSEVVDIVRGILDGTKTGRFAWDQANPTTFFWVNEKGQISIQMVVKRQLMSNDSASRAGLAIGSLPAQQLSRDYLLRAQNLEGEVQFQVSSTKSEELAELLKSLYAAARESFDRKGLDFLKSLFS